MGRTVRGTNNPGTNRPGTNSPQTELIDKEKGNDYHVVMGD